MSVVRLDRWLGLLAAVVFVLAVAGFGAGLEGYAQARHPVALLGARGVPHALAFNLLGLQGEALQLACTRRWSLPFVPPSASARQRLPELANRLGFAVVQGNRMGHLLGADVSKGRALEVLKQRSGGSPVRVLALGDSPNDQPLLEAGDLSVVVPGANGPHPVFADALAQGRYQLAPACHAQGWAEAVFQHVLNAQC